MDIQTQKLELFEWLSSIKDAAVINQLSNFKKALEGTDWWDTISEEEKKEIEAGLKQADKGELIEHAEVMKKYDKWL